MDIMEFVFGISTGVFVAGGLMAFYQARISHTLNLRLKVLEKEGIEALENWQKNQIQEEYKTGNSSLNSNKKKPSWDN